MHCVKVTLAGLGEYNYFVSLLVCGCVGGGVYRVCLGVCSVYCLFKGCINYF